jgi:hypothetical protein
MEIVKLSQLPIIEDSIDKIGDEVKKEIESLNLEKQIATADSIKYLKELRARLNKDFAGYETSRKELSKKINAPYEKVNEKYKLKIANVFQDADETLKNSIAKFELLLKQEKYDNLKLYFEQLVFGEDELEFIKFDDIKLNIILSTSEQKYKTDILSFVDRVKSDLKLISTQSYQSEILVEYKTSLNVSESIQKITDRKEKEKAETERLKLIELQKRQSTLLKLGFKYETDIDVYVNESVNMSISKKELGEMENVKYTSFIIQSEEKIKTLELQNKQTEIPFDAPKVQAKPEVIKSEPKTEVKEQVYSITFTTIGTVEQLKKVKEYILSLGLTFKRN